MAVLRETNKNTVFVCLFVCVCLFVVVFFGGGYSFFFFPSFRRQDILV